MAIRKYGPALQRLRAEFTDLGRVVGDGRILTGWGDAIGITIAGRDFEPPDEFGLEPGERDSCDNPIWAYQWRKLLPEDWYAWNVFSLLISGGGVAWEQDFFVLEPGDGRSYYIESGDVEGAGVARPFAAVEPSGSLATHEALVYELFASEGQSLSVRFGSLAAASIAVWDDELEDPIRRGFVAAARNVRARGGSLPTELREASEEDFDEVAGRSVSA